MDLFRILDFKKGLDFYPGPLFFLKHFVVDIFLHSIAKNNFVINNYL